MGKHRVLVVDDEWNMRNLLRIYLTKNGFEVKEATNGREALQTMRQLDFDLVILDIMMPDMDGWQVCQKIRETNAVPILMLTARMDTQDKVHGLGIGADDYVVKPFEPEELMARVFALIRRITRYTGSSFPHEIKLDVPEMTIYPEGRQVKIKGAPVEFTNKEFDILLLLAKNPGRAYSRELLVERLWGIDYMGETRVVDTHIKNIREKVQKAGLSYNPIQTMWGLGYKFFVPEMTDELE